MSEANKKKLSELHKGKPLSKETKRKISEAQMGRKMPPFTEEHRKKISEWHKGKISSRKGAHLSEETKQKIKLANIGKKLSEETRQKISNSQIGRLPWNKGKKLESRPKQSLQIMGKNNPNWRGGISFEPYSKDWSDDLKDSIRKRDNYMCRECGIHQDELDGFHKVLDVHHIDYIKNNLDPNNLITICKGCHVKTNYNREYWIEYFSKETYVAKL